MSAAEWHGCDREHRGNAQNSQDMESLSMFGGGLVAAPKKWVAHAASCRRGRSAGAGLSLPRPLPEDGPGHRTFEVRQPADIGRSPISLKRV